MLIAAVYSTIDGLHRSHRFCASSINYCEMIFSIVTGPLLTTTTIHFKRVVDVGIILTHKMFLFSYEGFFSFCIWNVTLTDRTCSEQDVTKIQTTPNKTERSFTFEFACVTTINETVFMKVYPNETFAVLLSILLAIRNGFIQLFLTRE